MNAKVKATVVVVLSILFIACINTRYSRTDESEITTNITYLILGEFAHHGSAFYEHEVSKNLKELENKPDSFDARNDLASAYTKLERYDEAEQEFLLNEKRHPGRYKTASNLGVLYKKMGRYKDASDAIKRALQIKPEGHMGLGDYYLRMIDWMEKHPYKHTENVVPKENFLGIPYSVKPEEVKNNPLVLKKHLETLIKNDYKFPDTYIVLGDVLYAEKNYQMALRAYFRAKELNHPNEEIVGDRIIMIHNYWEKNKKDGYVLDYGDDQLYHELKSAEEWLNKFKKIEAEELAAGRPVDFRSLHKAARKAGLNHTKVMDAIHYAGVVIDGKKNEKLFIVGPAIFLVIAAIILGFFVFRFIGKFKRA